MMPAKTQTSKRPLDDAPILEWAFWYAGMGLYVLPLHEPLFDDNGGCTCEAWHREKLHADYVCKTPGKHPRHSGWEDKATTDQAQIAKWWRAWPTANIGIAAGKSGLVVLDADRYKDTYGGGNFDNVTVTSLTGGGGEHWFYLHPADGPKLGNATGELPEGIDVRGWGGFVVAAPSLHPSGRRYDWEAEYGPDDMDLAPLPDDIRQMLTDAATRPTKTAVIFSENGSGKKPDLNQWGLSEIVREAIKLEPDPNSDRSSVAQSVISSLIRGGAADDDIKSVFDHFPIGYAGKYGEKGKYAASWLAQSVSKARSYLNGAAGGAAHKPPEQDITFENLHNQARNLSGDDEKKLKLAAFEIARQCAHVLLTPGQRSIILDELTSRAKVDKSTLIAEIAHQKKQQRQSKNILDLINRGGWGFSFNTMTEQVFCNGKDMTDTHLSQITTYVQDRLTNVGKERVADVIVTGAAHNEFHPLRDYFEGLPAWDGIERVNILINSLHLVDEQQAQIFRHWLVSVPDKLFNGGRHFTLVLDGHQGIGKSTLVRGLVPRRDWYNETMFSPGNKDTQIMLTKCLIWELGELQKVFKKSDREELKAALTWERVTVRAPYKRFDITRPVTCSFFATVNNTGTGFLSDPTGNSRYAVIKSTVPYGKRFDDAWLALPVDLLWSEIWHLYKQGMRGELPEDLAKKRDMLNEQYESTSPALDLFETVFTYDPSRERPLTDYDNNGGIWKPIEIVQMLEDFFGLRAQQGQSLREIKEHLVQVTKEPAQVHKLPIAYRQPTDPTTKRGWNGIWLTKYAGEMLRDAANRTVTDL